MHVQKIKNPAPGPLKGIGIVAGLIAAIAADRLLTGLLPDPAGTLAFWAVGLLLALWTLRRYVLGYSYALAPELLRLSYTYGRYERLLTDIYYNNLLAVGTPEAVKARWPNAKVTRACPERHPAETLAVVCRDGGQPSVYLLKPDAEVRAKLEGVCAAARKK